MISLWHIFGFKLQNCFFLNIYKKQLSKLFRPTGYLDTLWTLKSCIKRDLKMFFSKLLRRNNRFLHMFKLRNVANYIATWKFWRVIRRNGVLEEIMKSCPLIWLRNEILYFLTKRREMTRILKKTFFPGFFWTSQRFYNLFIARSKKQL